MSNSKNEIKGRLICETKTIEEASIILAEELARLYLEGKIKIKDSNLKK